MDVNKNLIARIWKEADPKPHRLDRRLPLSPGRAERHAFEYRRHGTLSLYAALNPQTGEVLGQTAPCHTRRSIPR